MSASQLHKDLTWRGLIRGETIGFKMAMHQPEGFTLYLGIDPTATSLHVGSLLPIVCLNKFLEHHYKVIILIGGGTAMIGDPSGKKNERQMLSPETVETNIIALKDQIKRLVPGATIINNADWLHQMSIMNFLRTVGKHFSLNYMRDKESVRSREENGISFTEFSYMLLQAYDFLHLHQHHGCTVQIGGSDQWGNITCGLDLIRKENGVAHGMTFPLLTTSTGEKFGKSASGTVWLDPKLTAPYRFHQFWLNTDDKDVIQYLRYFTSLPKEHIDNMEELMPSYADQRVAQRTLADAVTLMVHGADEVIRCNQIRELLFGNNSDMSSLKEGEIEVLFGPELVHGPVPMNNDGVKIVEALVSSGVFNSKGEVKRAIDGGGLYVNGSNIKDTNHALVSNDLLHGKYLIIRKGKKDHHVIVFNTIKTEEAVI